jgi:hypothetical protein
LQQDIDLIQEYNSILDEFKKRHGMLVDVAEKTQLKIKQVTGLRDGVSASHRPDIDGDTDRTADFHNHECG